MRVLLTQEAIAARVLEIGRQIAADYAGNPTSSAS
jgi:hypoxanthine-guanine phosphoribosyltransferase